MTSTSAPVIHSPKDAAELIRYEMATFTQEQLWVLLLDTRNRLLEIDRLYKGSLNSSMVRVGELFKTALQPQCGFDHSGAQSPQRRRQPFARRCGADAPGRAGRQTVGCGGAGPPGDWSGAVCVAQRKRVGLLSCVSLTNQKSHSKIRSLMAR